MQPETGSASSAEASQRNRTVPTSKPGNDAPRLPQELVEHILHLFAVSTRSEYLAAIRPQDPWSRSSHPPLSCSHLAKLCLLSRGLNEAFTKVLYRSVVLTDDRAVASLYTTLSASHRHGRFVRHLAILTHEDLRAAPALLGHVTPQASAGAPDPSNAEAMPVDGLGSDGISADDLLAFCPNTTHAMLSRARFRDWSPGLYSLVSAREVTLLGVSRSSDLDGLVSRHRETVTTALQNNPAIQALLSNRVGSWAPTEEESSPPASGSSSAMDSGSSNDSSSGVSDRRHRSRLPMARLPLTHLHLVNFDGRLIHHLAQLTSLTHLVLSYPARPNNAAGVPGLAVIPRSHLLLLLGSGRIRRIVIRAAPSTCHRIMEEIAPIQDEKLIFRPIRLKAGGIGAGHRYRTRRSDDPGSSTSNSSGSSNFQGVREVDFLAEWWERVHLDAFQHRRGDQATAWASSGSSRERGNSTSSSEMEADSSWSDDRDRNSSGEAASGSALGAGSGSGIGSGSYDSDVYSDDDDVGGDDDGSGFSNSSRAGLYPQDSREHAGTRAFVPSWPLPSQASQAGAPSSASIRAGPASPLYEAPGPSSGVRGPFQATSQVREAASAQPMPARAAPPPQIPIETLLQFESLEQARQRRDAGLLAAIARPVSRPRARNSDRRIRPGAYAARRSDVRGATTEGLERLAEVVARQGDAPEEETMQHFW